jgi:hypothetical protein
MPDWITLALQTLKNFSDMANRETSADEQVKDGAVHNSKDSKKAEAAARKIFDGDNKFPGVDVLAKTLFDEKTYKEYLKRKAEYNKYSS